MNAHNKTKKSFYTGKTILPISWGIDYSRFNALIHLKNELTGFNDARLVDYRVFCFDQDLAEAALNISLMELVRESFNNDDAYLDWLEYAIKLGEISEEQI